MKTLKIYLSHPIRGVSRYPAPEYVTSNLRKSIEFAEILRAIDDLEVYCPAEHEEFVGRAIHGQYMTIPEVLEVDKQILDTCDAVIFYNFEGMMSAGMQEEFDRTIFMKKPFFILVSNVCDFGMLVKEVEKLREQAGKHE